MGYRDDFYVAANIIGYTGKLHEKASIYFQAVSEFGHITQAHGFGGNIGREKVRNNATYVIRNQIDPISKKEVCVEIENGNVMHTSRNLFHPVADEKDRALAAQAITAFQDLKTVYNVENSPFHSPYGVQHSDLIDPHKDITIGGHRS